MAPSQPRRVPPQACRVDPKIWRACAGAAVKIPPVNSRVYYFPQGHLEQASSPSSHFFSRLRQPLPFVICRVSAVDLVADPITDEVFAKLLLNPISDNFPAAGGEYAAEENGGDKIVSFSKVLTASDANNGGGFSVPRFCADSVFPPLNFEADPPVQLLSITDVHGETWKFRHIYRGTPRRHLLTTGWSKFVNHKKLVAGDTVVFMKDSRGSVFVGIRRLMKFAASAVSSEEEELIAGDGGDFSRTGRGKVSGEAVANAMELAAQKAAFEVVCYPRAGWSDFVVQAEAVDGAMMTGWCAGMKVKMALETEDSSRMTWFQGIVSSASFPDNGPWTGSPWRMLQVTWDEPEGLPNAKRVSPWQVELVNPAPLIHEVFPPAKKFRTAQGSRVLSDREGDPFKLMTGLTNSTMVDMNRTLLSFDTFPAGMQGARHDLYPRSSFYNFLNDNSGVHMRSNPARNITVPSSNTVSTELSNITVPSLNSVSTGLNNFTVLGLNAVSTELSIGSSQSDHLSPGSQSSLHSTATELVATHESALKVDPVHLFGVIISRPAEIDAQCQQPSPVETCYF